MICDILIVNCKLMFISSVKYPLSVIFYEEDLWNVLQLLWNVKNEDVFEQILNHSGSLEMIYGTTIDSEETKNDHPCSYSSHSPHIIISDASNDGSIPIVIF